MKAVSGGRPGRRGFRKALLLGSALLFPVTMLYFSPGMVFRGARLGILSGSYLTFAALFLGALVAGRAWCGFLCPGGGLCETARAVNDDPFRRGGLKAVKYVVWILWLAGIALVAVFVGHGFHAVDPLLGTDRGVSIHSLELWPFYYLVIGIILALSLSLGRRGFCHTLCWMAPFMVLGRGLRNAMRTPALQLAADPEGCPGCGACRKVCPMSLPVPELVRTGSLEHRDCILCGECVRACTKGCIRLEFGRPSAVGVRSGMNRGER
ncbi:MAG TPA: 4Fe-4S binding protein [Spirochaetia bacterium]|nr:4Fe-4S binding protein [Spirochaetales bacterium]HRY78921.1 4Fe-4S binding protein [Spirochaetia bacterium]HRZ88749.1 4Fe-4S binding protein [Spirochaetia bacterium]